MRKRPINKFWIVLLGIATSVAVLLSVMSYLYNRRRTAQSGWDYCKSFSIGIRVNF